MKAKVTLTFSDDTVETFAKIFNIKDYSKLPEVLKSILVASIKTDVDDESDELDELTVEMIE